MCVCASVRDKESDEDDASVRTLKRRIHQVCKRWSGRGGEGRREREREKENESIPVVSAASAAAAAVTRPLSRSSSAQSSSFFSQKSA